MFTITNKGYVNFVKSFIERLQQINFTNQFHVICTDEESYYELLNIHNNVICSLWRGCNITTDFVGWKNKLYTELVFTKFDITRSVLELAQKRQIQYVLYTDCDIWFFKNFKEEMLTYLATLSNIDVFMQDGEDYREQPEAVTWTNIDNKLTKNRNYKRLCTGFMLLKPKMSWLFDYKANAKIEWTKYIGNQPYLNDVLLTENIDTIGLPRDKAINGSIFSTVNDFTGVVDPWLIHYTYLIREEKILKMKYNNHWAINE